MYFTRMLAFGIQFVFKLIGESKADTYAFVMCHRIEGPAFWSHIILTAYWSTQTKTHYLNWLLPTGCWMNWFYFYWIFSIIFWLLFFVWFSVFLTHFIHFPGRKIFETMRSWIFRNVFLWMTPPFENISLLHYCIFLMLARFADLPRAVCLYQTRKLNIISHRRWTNSIVVSKRKHSKRRRQNDGDDDRLIEQIYYYCWFKFFIAISQ